MREICLAETLLQFFTHACYNLHLRHRPVEAAQLPLHFPQVLEFLRKVHSSPHITICYTKYSYLLSPCQEVILPRISGRVKSSDILSRRRKRVMQKVQKTYTTEFKREAVHLAQTSGKPITQIARELGISDTSIHQWRQELTEHGTEAFPGSGHQTAQEEELRRLKRELERTQKERDILKKALAIFSQTPL